MPNQKNSFKKNNQKSNETTNKTIESYDLDDLVARYLDSFRLMIDTLKEHNERLSWHTNYKSSSQ